MTLRDSLIPVSCYPGVVGRHKKEIKSRNTDVPFNFTQILCVCVCLSVGIYILIYSQT